MVYPTAFHISERKSIDGASGFDLHSSHEFVPPIVNGSLSVGDKSLELKDAYRLSELRRTPDSLSFVCEISDGMSAADMNGFLSSLVENHAKVKGAFDDGEVEYWVVSASLDDNTLSVVASILEPV